MKKKKKTLSALASTACTGDNLLSNVFDLDQDSVGVWPKNHFLYADLHVKSIAKSETNF